MRRPVLPLVALLACLLVPAASAGAAVTSTFDTDLDGWTVSGDPANGSPFWVSSGGNPGGFARVVDGASGPTIYWEAPAKFEGNQCGAYGGHISYSLKADSTSSPFNDIEVIFEGGGVQLRREEPHPGTAWTTYVVPLNAAGWTLAGGGNPTEAQFKQVLSNVTRLAIRAEFRSGVDTNDLDTVSLTDGPCEDRIRGEGTLAATANALTNDFSISPTQITFTEHGTGNQILGYILCTSVSGNRGYVVYVDYPESPQRSTPGGFVYVEDHGLTGDRLGNGRLSAAALRRQTSSCPVPSSAKSRPIASGDIDVIDAP